LHAGPHTLQSPDDHDVTGLQALANDAQSVERAPELHPSVFQFVSVAKDEHVVLRLIGGDGALFNQERIVFAAAWQLYARKQPGREYAVLVCEQGAPADGAGAYVELVVDEVHVAFVREAFLVREAHAHRIRDVTRAGALARARELLIVQIRVLVAFEVNVDW